MSGKDHDPHAGKLCCRECGEWKALYDIDPQSIFFKSKDADTMSFTLKVDIETPLCADCRRRTYEAAEE